MKRYILSILFVLIMVMPTWADVAICDGAACSNKARVDTNLNLGVVQPTTNTQAGFGKLTDGLNNATISREGRLRIGRDILHFYESVDYGGATVNTNNWLISQLTMTQAISSGFIVLNTAALTTINTYSIITSNKQPQILTEFPLATRWALKTPNVPQANATMEFGLGFVATTAAPTGAGVYFRYDASDSTFRCIANWSGTETKSAALTNPSINVVHFFDLVISHNNVDCYVDDVLVASIVPAANAVPMVPTHIPAFARVYTGAGIPATAPQLFVSFVSVVNRGGDLQKNWMHQNAAFARNLVAAPSSVGTFSQLTQWANTTQPAAITAVNTCVGAYTTPGGLYILNAVVTGTTDLCVFSYQIPVGFQLYITDAWISIMNTTVAVATTASVFQWALACNSSATSLATADSAGITWQPRRVPMGLQSFPIAAAVGATVPEIVRHFDVPLTCESGRFLHVLYKPTIGTATATETFTGLVGLVGYFE